MRIENRKFLLLVVTMTGCISLGFNSQSDVWERQASGIGESRVTALAIHPQNSNLMYIGTERAVYFSDDGGERYAISLSLQGEQKRVNDIYIPPQAPELIYAATEAGLYQSQDLGKHWNRIYYSADPASKSALSVIQYENKIYLGTGRGLFVKSLEETQWHKVKQAVNNEAIYQIIDDQQFIYFATNKEVWRLRKEKVEIKKIFSFSFGKTEEDIFNGKTSVRGPIKYIAVAASWAQSLFIATSGGIHFSLNYGEDWQRLPVDNIPLDEITSVLALPKDAAGSGLCEQSSKLCVDLLIGSHRGVFLLRNGRGSPIFKGIETNEIHCLVKDAQENVYAATDRGVFKLPVEQAFPSLYMQGISQEDYKQAAEILGQEPTINEVHSLAIEYAEVHPSKIANWRRLARAKALLPRLSAGLDRAGTDIYHWDTGQSPDVLQKGKEYLEWDVSLSWDFSDLIWSTDQTTIDSRSKLMVELREDILNQVTRLYFERRRLQLELLTVKDWEPQLRMDKEMRVEELTALIDTLTGGEFSRQLH